MNIANMRSRISNISPALKDLLVRYYTLCNTVTHLENQNPSNYSKQNFAT